MIRVIRGAEPPELPPIRSQEVARVEALVGKQPKLDFGDKYKGPSSNRSLFRQLLHNAQHNKCCFCETIQEESRRDVEHFRPKSVYWWLAWTWENLLFACDHCNRDHKKTHFELRDEGARLSPKDSPPGHEDALLLDPASATVNPLDHIQFRLVSSSGDWWPIPRGQSDYGEYTIRVCGLARPGLRDAYRAHHRSLLPTIEALKEELDRADDAQSCGDDAPMRAARSRFDKLVAAQFSPSMALTALTIDIYDHYFPARLRELYGLSWPRP